jgi:hypothetical protein
MAWTITVRVRSPVPRDGWLRRERARQVQNHDAHLSKAGVGYRPCLAVKSIRRLALACRTPTASLLGMEWADETESDHAA